MLYEGPARLHLPGEELHGNGQLVFDWRRSPGIKWLFAIDRHRDDHDRAFPAFLKAMANRRADAWLEPVADKSAASLPAEPTALWADAPPNSTFFDNGYQPRGTVLGNSTGFSGVILHLVNFIDDRISSPSLEAKIGDFDVAIQRTSQAASRFKTLKSKGGHAFTHAALLRRTDRHSFGFDTVEGVTSTIWHVLQFGAGRQVGIALPTGIDEHNQPIGVSCDVLMSEPYSGRLSWLDPFHLDDLEPIFDRLHEFQGDPFWSQVVRRAIRSYVSGTDGNPIDQAVVTVVACLELLAWAILEVDETWLDPRDGNLSLAGRLRLLLRWASIDSTVPSQLEALTKLQARDMNIVDGPSAIVWVRNRLVHPPRLKSGNAPGWPSYEELHEAWRLGLEYGSLILLRLLGHSGDYGSLLHMAGRCQGDMTAVPWQDQHARGQVRSRGA